MKKLSILLLTGVLLELIPRVGRCGPPGSEGPMFTDPVAQKKYEQWQAMLEAGPYFKQVSRALPFDSELSGYTVKRVVGDVGSSVKAVRRKDKVELTIGIVSSSNREIMKYLADIRWRGDNAMDGPYPQGSPSGRPLGQSSTQNIDQKNGVTYGLQVVDSPTQINLGMTAHLNSNEKLGHPTWKPITKADQLFMEHLARLMLRRLKTLKLTHDTFKP